MVRALNAFLNVDCWTFNLNGTHFHISHNLLVIIFIFMVKKSLKCFFIAFSEEKKNYLFSYLVLLLILLLPLPLAIIFFLLLFICVFFIVTIKKKEFYKKIQTDFIEMNERMRWERNDTWKLGRLMCIIELIYIRVIKKIVFKFEFLAIFWWFAI